MSSRTETALVVTGAVAALILLLTARCLAAFAAAPLGASLALHSWFDGAETPNCVSCCGRGDGRVVLARPDPSAGAGWDVLLGDVWRPVPAGIRATRCVDSLPHGHYPLHPAGNAVIWWLWNGALLCWSPPGWSG